MVAVAALQVWLCRKAMLVKMDGRGLTYVENEAKQRPETKAKRRATPGLKGGPDSG